MPVDANTTVGVPILISLKYLSKFLTKGKPVFRLIIPGLDEIAYKFWNIFYVETMAIILYQVGSRVP